MAQRNGFKGNKRFSFRITILQSYLLTSDVNRLIKIKSQIYGLAMTIDS